MIGATTLHSRRGAVPRRRFGRLVRLSLNCNIFRTRFLQSIRIAVRYQQPAAPAEAAAGDPRDGVADVAVGAARHGVRRAGLRRHEPRVDRQRVAALAR